MAFSNVAYYCSSKPELVNLWLILSMIFFILNCVVLLCIVTFLSMPWISLIAYNVTSVMQPQTIWPWAFNDYPVYRIFAGLAIASFLVSVANKKINFDILKNKQNLAVIIIFIMVHLSDIFAPINDAGARHGADFLLSILNTVILFYFITQLTLRPNELYLKCMVYSFIGVIIYYTYWSNNAYFSYDYRHFTQGRLHGPFKGPYTDENKFSTLFVIGLPFLIMLFFYSKSLLLKLIIGIIASLVLHSIFLTGSRGALLATGFCVFLISKSVKSKAFSITIIGAFILAVTLQAGNTLNRSEESVAASQAEEEVNPRIRSWTIGIEIIKQYPILGVGAQRFQDASRKLFPQYGSSYVAHNTFFQIASNSGLLAGLLYIYIYFYNLRAYRLAIKNKISHYPFLDYANHSIFIALTGFYVSSIFLDLLIFEGYYLLLALSAVTHYIFNDKIRITEIDEAYKLEKQEAKN